MFEILPTPSLETIMMIGRAALLFGAFWIFALAFTRWRRAEERRMQHLCSEMQRTFAEIRSLHETLAVMSARIESLSERPEVDPRLAPTAAVGAQRGYDLAARLAKNGAGGSLSGSDRDGSGAQAQRQARADERAAGHP